MSHHSRFALPESASSAAVATWPAFSVRALLPKTSFAELRRLLLTLLVVGMLCSLAACTKFVTLQAGLLDADANEIVLVLTRYGIEVSKSQAKEGVTLTVKEEDLSRATEAMNSAGLPRRTLSNLGEVFKKQGMISSPMEERIRYIHGLSEELESTLQQFDNVISARVHVVLPERIAPGEPIQPSSAAVFIKYRAPMDEDSITPRIRRLVAASIPGLVDNDGRNKVSVVMTRGETPPPAMEWTFVGPFQITADSAGPLRNTLVVLFMTVLGLILYVAYLVLRDHPKLGPVFRLLEFKRSKKAKSKVKDDAAEGEPQAVP